MSTMIKVGMADLKVVEFPDALTTLGLRVVCRNLFI